MLERVKQTPAIVPNICSPTFPLNFKLIRGTPLPRPLNSSDVSDVGERNWLTDEPF